MILAEKKGKEKDAGKATTGVFLYPIDEHVKPVSPARDVVSRFIRKRMLSHSLLTA